MLDDNQKLLYMLIDILLASKALNHKYPSDFSSSALRIPPPAAPRIVL
jgi:hypothetical protein